MDEIRKKHNYIEDYLSNIRSKGKYSFSWMALKQEFSLSDNALNQRLFQLRKRNKIALIRKGFYVIIPPEYSQQKMLPVALFIDDLMQFLNRRYYVAFFSASALHSAAHQQPMEYYVVIEKPAMRAVIGTNFKINFLVKKGWSDSDIIKKKSDSGYFNVSSPELTALDLLYYSNYTSISHIATILNELAIEMQPTSLYHTALRYPLTASIQRLGYLLNKVTNREKLCSQLKKALGQRKFNYVPLNANIKNEGLADNEWKVMLNTIIETDL